MNGNRATKWMKTLGPFFLFTTSTSHFSFSSSADHKPPASLHQSTCTGRIQHLSSSVVHVDTHVKIKGRWRRRRRKRINFLPERIDKSTHTQTHVHPKRDGCGRACLSFLLLAGLYFFGGVRLWKMEGRAIGKIVSFISLFVDGKYKTSNTGGKK